MATWTAVCARVCVCRLVCRPHSLFNSLTAYAVWIIHHLCSLSAHPCKDSQHQRYFSCACGCVRVYCTCMPFCQIEHAVITSTTFIKVSWVIFTCPLLSSPLLSSPLLLILVPVQGFLKGLLRLMKMQHPSHPVPFCLLSHLLCFHNVWSLLRSSCPSHLAVHSVVTDSAFPGMLDSRTR